MNQSEDSPHLKKLLSEIQGYANEVTFFNDPEHRQAPALALLKIAIRATSELNRIWQGHHPHVREDLDTWFSEIAPQLEFWPVPFNEGTDLTPYKKLRIGYDRLDSKDPKRRTGKTIFARYAYFLVERINYLRNEAIAARIGETWEGYADLQVKRRQHEWVTYVETLFSPNGPQTPERRLNTYRPKSLRQIEELPDFSKETVEKWKKAGKNLFKQALPNCQNIIELAKEINDSGVEYESQIRAQIIERIGRAIGALAKKRKTRATDL